tara:strand:- start:1477 stop:1848 length:372 start_codon:yes stop_codon:yes gene_type:complete
METKEQIEMKKQYIYENINKVSDHKHYIHLIEMNKSPHTKNSNGIFINLNTASDTIIHQFYTYIKNELMNNNLNSNSIEKKFYQDKIDLVKKKKETRIEYKKITMKDFKDKKDILQVSKLYDL